MDALGRRFAVGQSINAYTADVSGTSMAVWDMAKGKFIAGGEGKLSIDAVALSADGEFAYYSTEHSVRKICVFGSKLVLSIPHEGAVTGVAFLPGKEVGLSVSRAGEILVWRTDTGVVLTRLFTNQSLEACAISPDGETFVVGDNEGSVCFFAMVGGATFPARVQGGPEFLADSLIEQESDHPAEVQQGSYAENEAITLKSTSSRGGCER
jgi:WD40 repeat protein